MVRALAYQRIGDILVQQTKTDEALASYRRSLDLQKANMQISNDPEPLSRKHSAVVVDGKIAGLLASVGRTDESVGYYRDAVLLISSSLSIPELTDVERCNLSRWPWTRRATYFSRVAFWRSTERERTLRSGAPHTCGVGPAVPGSAT
jgi:hypothetical protein